MTNQKTNFYEALQIHKSSTQEEIQKSYRKLAKIYHPDMNPGNESKFQTILEGKQIQTQIFCSLPSTL
jgi:DnaJ-class molecular chaperone